MPVVELVLVAVAILAVCLGVLLITADRKLARERAALTEARQRCEQVARHALAERAARQTTEAAMCSSEGRIQAILEAAVDGIVIIDQSGRILSFNRAAERIFQYSTAEVEGADVSMLMPEPDRSAHGLYLKNYLSTGQARIIGIGREVRGRRKDGTTFPMHLAVGESRREARRIFAGIIRDLSERATVEERLFESEEKFRLLMDGIPEYAITLLDGAGNITSWNAGAERIYGWSAEEALGKPFALMFTPGNQTIGEPERILAAAGQDGCDKGEFVQRRKDGSTFWTHETLAALRGEEGKLRGYIRIARDLTKQRAEEQVLVRAKEEAERANVAKSRFLAAASHDLRQPVQALMFFTSALGTRLKDESFAGMLKNLEQSLEGLNALLESLLDVSKLDAGVVSPQIEEFPLTDLFERLEREFGPVAMAKGLQLRVIKTREIVRSDPALLGRILSNLVANAVRYTHRGKVVVGCRRAGHALRIDVWDSGIGIPSTSLEEIFQEFTQLGNFERNRAQGLGLGLAIVRRLGTLLDHPVAVHSTPGKGSVFSVTLPRATQRDWRRKTLAAQSNDRLVVIIDDEASVLKGLGLILEAWGFEVLAASSEDEAISRLEAYGQRPGAILADYRLRDGHTGTEAVRHIRALFDAAIPSIIITGDTAPERLREAEASGFAIIHKPVQPPDLRNMLASRMTH